MTTPSIDAVMAEIDARVGRCRCNPCPACRGSDKHDHVCDEAVRFLCWNCTFIGKLRSALVALREENEVMRNERDCAYDELGALTAKAELAEEAARYYELLDVDKRKHLYERESDWLARYRAAGGEQQPKETR